MKQLKNIIGLLWDNLELISWVSALVLLFLMKPEENHFTLCPISYLGFSFCPGCGLGHSIHYAMHLNFTASFSYHPLGIIAIFIILFRIIKLVINFLNYYRYEHETYAPHPGS